MPLEERRERREGERERERELVSEWHTDRSTERSHKHCHFIQVWSRYWHSWPMLLYMRGGLAQSCNWCSPTQTTTTDKLHPPHTRNISFTCIVICVSRNLLSGRAFELWLDRLSSWKWLIWGEGTWLVAALAWLGRTSGQACCTRDEPHTTAAGHKQHNTIIEQQIW